MSIIKKEYWTSLNIWVLWTGPHLRSEALQTGLPENRVTPHELGATHITGRALEIFALSFPLWIQQKSPFSQDSGTLPTLPVLSDCKIQQGIINNRLEAKNTSGESCQREGLTSMTSAWPLIFSPECKKREYSWGEGMKRGLGSAQVALVFSDLWLHKSFPRA